MSRTSDLNPALAAIFNISLMAVNASPRPLASGSSQKLSSPAGWSLVRTAAHRTASETNWGKRTATLPRARSSSGRQIARVGPRSSDISARSHARRSSAIHHQGRRYSSLVIRATRSRSPTRHRRSLTSGTSDNLGVLGAFRSPAGPRLAAGARSPMDDRERTWGVSFRAVMCSVGGGGSKVVSRRGSVPGGRSEIA